jgi:hypothetical protein
MCVCVCARVKPTANVAPLSVLLPLNESSMPRLPASLAVASPMPLVAPVIMTTFPAREVDIAQRNTITRLLNSGLSSL